MIEMPSCSPMAASGGDPKWSIRARMLPGEWRTWSATGGSHSTTPTPMLRAPMRSVRRRSAGPAPRSDHAAAAERQHDHRHTERQVRHVGLGAVRRGDDQHHEGHRVAGQHGPRGEQHQHPRHHRQVRVPRLGQRVLSIAAQDEGEQRRTGGQPGPPEAPHGEPQGGADGDEVDEDRADLHRPRRRAEHAIGRGEQVEAQRPGVAALVRVGADASRQADQRGVPAEHVADPELGHRQVEHGVPGRAVQHGDGDDQRQADHERHDPDRPCRHPAADARRSGDGLGTRRRRCPASRSPARIVPKHPLQNVSVRMVVAGAAMIRTETL